MTKKKTTAPAYLTREILKEEISASEQRLTTKIDVAEKRLDAKIDGVEKRLDTKIDASTQSMKDYTDSRFNRSDAKTDALDAKMTKYFELMMQMITGFQKEIKSILTNHACVPKRLCAVQGF